MTEADWVSSTNPQTMLGLLNHTDGADTRKLRLFAAACCRRHWELLSEQGRRAVELMEGAADGREDVGTKAACQKGRMSFSAAPSAGMRAFFAHGAITYLLLDRSENVVGYAMSVSSWAAGAGRSRAGEQAAQADILRDVFGAFLFRTPPRNAIERRWIDWNEGTVARLARAIYDRQAFEQMPILADALEEAGCTKEGILKHAREAGTHVRGCWLLDAILN